MVKLSFERYDPQALSKYDIKTLRKEYSRLRSIARKRLDRLSTSEYNETATYRLNKNKYKPLGRINSKSELVNRLSALGDFISARSSTITGQRGIERERISTLHEHGYTWINKSNLREFGEFMQFLKARYPHVPSADEEELKTLYQGYKTIRAQAINAEQVQTIFDRWQNETRPNSYYLRPQFTEIPPSAIMAELPEEFR